MEVDGAVALPQMKQAIQDLGSSADDYEDGTLLRFLVTRSMAPKKAAKMFVQWQAWRASMVPSGSIAADEVRDQLNSRTTFLGGLTREGYRLLVCQGRGHYPIKDKHQFKKFMIYMLDKVIASAYEGGRETGNKKFVALLDLGQISLKNVDARAFIIGFQVLQAYYPGCLAKCYILDMPRFFVSVWSVISSFLEKTTKEMVTIVNNEDEKKELVNAIGEDVLPEEYGGKTKLVALQDFTM